jgi:hypothetical protein
MRWDALFDDMEAQLASRDLLDLESEVAERWRADIAGVDLADRLRGSMGLRVGAHLTADLVFEGTLSHVGGESLVLNDGPHQVLIPFEAVARYQGLGRLAVAEPSNVRRKLGLASALRGLARDRAHLRVFLRFQGGGEAALSGVIDRVGRDHFDLAVTHPGEARRASDVSRTATVPFGRLAALKSLR